MNTNSSDNNQGKKTSGVTSAQILFIPEIEDGGGVDKSLFLASFGAGASRNWAKVKSPDFVWLKIELNLL